MDIDSIVSGRPWHKAASLLTPLAAALWLLVSAPAAAGRTPPNVLKNPDLEGPAAAGLPEGWGRIWTRAPGTGTLTQDSSVRHGGESSLRITHTGGLDWSAEQSATVPVTAGDILRFGAWVRCEDTDSAEISLVTRGADGGVLDWSAGALEAGGTHDWRRLSRTLVIPPGCASVQFRFIGTGRATAWLDDAELIRVGTVGRLQSHVPALSLHNRSLAVTVGPGGRLTIADRRNGRIWRQRAVSADMIVTDARRQGTSALRLSLWDVADDLRLQAALTLAPDAPELAVALTGDGPLGGMVAFPQPFVSGRGSWLVVPLNEGIIYPVDDATIPSMQLPGYSGHGICMPWYGVTDPDGGAGLMTILGTPDDARIEITRQGKGGLFVRPLWEASRGRVRYARRLTYVVFDKGGYVAQAKRYRRTAKQAGLFKTLAQKRRENPNVDRLIGAVNIWNWDMDKVALCREMKALGMDRVLWSSGGSPAEVAAINGLDYLTSRYDIYQDVYPPDAPAWMQKAGWPQDLVRLPDGDWMKGWADIQERPDGTQAVYQGGVINSARGLARAKRDIPADLKATPYQCRFLDTTTASPFREDYDPAHPLTRSEDRHNKMALLGFCSGPMRQVVGTETGIDPSVPYVDYYEGMMSLGPYRLPDAGRDMLDYKAPTPDFLTFQVGHFYRVPLWELVYHECVVADWYWGDYNNKAPEVWPRRDLFNTLYATPPMFMFDKATWAKDKTRFAGSYQALCPLVRRLGCDEMLSHEFLSPDHAVQRTRWRSGTEITVNFGASDYRLPDDRIVRSLGSLVGRRQ